MDEPSLEKAPSADEIAAVGTRLGDFTILAVLGEGGSGTVYAAQWGHRQVALKVLRKTLLSTEGTRSRFREEAKLLAETVHPGIVKVLSSGELPDGRPYLAMEKLEGETLAQRIARGKLPEAEARAIFARLADAVASLHDH